MREATAEKLRELAEKVEQYEKAHPKIAKPAFICFDCGEIYGVDQGPCYCMKDD